ncbi:MAG: DUF6851 domain-containing protein [Myxococcota bacterium]
MPEAEWRSLGSELTEALLSVHGTAADDVWACGADKGEGPLVLHYDGEAWRRLDTGTEGDLWWVHAVEDGPVFFGGAGGTILRYDGTTFERMAAPGVGAQTVYGIWARSASDVYAVGSFAGGREGFVWRFDGTAWRDVPLPAEVPTNDLGSVPGLFKVWGDATTTWFVGGRGLVLRAGVDGALSTVAPPLTDTTLFSVHVAEGSDTAVGGAGNGVVLRFGDTSSDESPEAGELVQGVWMLSADRGWASGGRGSVFERVDGTWREVDTGLRLDIQSLHATWVDPTGGVWAVGGDVLSPELDNGALIHRGPVEATVSSEAPDGGVPDGGSPDGGMPDGQGPAPECPANEVDPSPDGSIARRWDEAALQAVRRAVPRPTVHARNLFHMSIGLWDAWSAYDPDADPVLESTPSPPPPADVAAARQEALSYAAYRILRGRYATEVGGDVSLACFEALMARLAYPTDGDGDPTTPRGLGEAIGEAVLSTYRNDGANEANDYADPNDYEASNPPMVVDQPGSRAENPGRWQQLSLSRAVTQNGIVEQPGVRDYIGPHWGAVTPFAIERPAAGEPYFDASPGPEFDDTTARDAVDLIRLSALLDPSLPETIDLSPGVYGNNSLGADDGTGHGMNPVTGAPYPPNVVSLADFGRVIAEIWADGPSSETPPGHWNVIANEVADHTDFETRLFGEGDVLDRLEWDVHVYLVLNGALHDAAIAAWEVKRVYESARPITLVRYMGERGQRTDPALPSFDAEGLPLVPDLVEVIDEASTAPGERHAHLAPYQGQIAVRSWRGEPGDRDQEVSGVAWIRAVEWMPYQRRSFVSPAFPGYVSGHSTFSRAAAEVLTTITGSPYYPGGLGELRIEPGYLVFEGGPAEGFTLTFASYYDAADQAGQSRLWGGIHIVPDDYVGRRIGSEVGAAAVARARSFFDGSAR